MNQNLMATYHLLVTRIQGGHQIQLLRNAEISNKLFYYYYYYYVYDMTVSI